MIDFIDWKIKNKYMFKVNSSGQIILLLLLVLVVGLGIGLSIIQRSLTDVSTSTKVEESSRAFSVAEAGLEKALTKGIDCPSGGCDVNFESENQSSAKVTDLGLKPLAQQALEYPPITKEEVAQFWFADPKTLAPFYNQDSITVYWGNPDAVTKKNDKPAIEITVISSNGSTYSANKFFYDSDSARRADNGFCDPGAGSGGTCSDLLTPITTTEGTNRKFYCRITIPDASYCKSPSPQFRPAGSTLIMARVRFLYTNGEHNVAFVPLAGDSLPPQARKIISVGSSGSTQRGVQLFTVDNVVPYYFDYAIFSAGDINK